MHYFGNPRHAKSLIAYMILTEYILEIPVKKRMILLVSLDILIGNKFYIIIIIIIA